MSEERRSRSIARILNRDGIWLGVGFVTPDRHVMTCAHVVGDALGDRGLARNSVPPQGEFLVEFPTSEIRVAPQPAKVAATLEDDYGWEPMDSASQTEDIAVVAVTDGPPSDVQPVALTRKRPPSLEPDFLAYGMPDRSRPVRYDQEPGGWPNGQFTDETAGRMIEVRAIRDSRAGFVKPGCSGGAAWSKSLGAAVGMVTMADPGRDVALVKPVTQLLQVWPAMQDALVDDENRITGGEMTWLTLIDRRPQEFQFSRALKAHFGARTDPVRRHRPLFCVVRGHHREGHDHLRTRFSIKPLAERHVLEANIRPVGVDWDYGVDVSEGLENMTFQLADGVSAADETPEGIATAINLAGQPRFFYATIGHEAFQPEDEALVGTWIEFWRAVADSPPGLTCECYVFLSFAYDEQESADTPIARFCAERLDGLLLGEGLASLRPLDRIQYEHVPTWFDTVLSTIKSGDTRQHAERKRAKVVAAVQAIFNEKNTTKLRMSDLIDHARDLSFDL